MPRITDGTFRIVHTQILIFQYFHDDRNVLTFQLDRDAWIQQMATEKGATSRAVFLLPTASLQTQQWTARTFFTGIQEAEYRFDHPRSSHGR
jgi:hypothetical protein